MSCPHCADLAAKLAEAEKEREFYRESFRKVIEVFTVVKQPWHVGLPQPEKKP